MDCHFFKLSCNRWLLLAIFCLQIHLEAFNSSIFYQKLQEPTPQWMIEQIEHDLAPFQKELSLKFLDDFFANEELFLARVRVANGVLTIQKSPSAARGVYNVFLNEKHDRIVDISDLLIAHIRELHRLRPLPDVDYIFTSCDYLPSYYKGPCMPPGNPIWPIFVMSKSKQDKGLILIPDWYSYGGYEPQKSHIIWGNALYPWHSKLNLLFFRGADSGAWDRSMWRNSPRPKLVALSLQYPDLINARHTCLLCYEENNAIREIMKKEGFMGDYVPMQDHSRYRYLIDIDGHCASTPRLPLLLHSNSVVLKNMTNSILWFYRAIAPYKHFIPVSEDLSDLFVQLDWAKNHDEECKEISNNARCLAAEVLTPETAYLYLFRLLEAYSKKQHEYYLED